MKSQPASVTHRSRLILARGIVQGVGFRPFVYTLATRLGLDGTVRNTSRGVEIAITGLPEAIDAFIQELRQSPPPLARIDAIEILDGEPAGRTGFVILDSQPEPGEFLPVSPDIAVCEDCRRELFDQTDRRYRYPFINCTNCGPRFTIIRDIPYDRPLTSMSGYKMCPKCQAEYDNPADRRFHAQPTACPVCGPRIAYTQVGKTIVYQEEALSTARELLKRGGILAVKGLGGCHLACDASNHQAVETLKQRKKRSEKPLALMAFELPVIEKYCSISEVERTLLESQQHPIVLLDRKADNPLAEGVASGLNTYGFMLPYTPLHLLLCEPAPDFPEVLVMTSGNLSEEPIAYEDADAEKRLAVIAEGFLSHDRPILMRVDDSVLCVIDNMPYFIRRARGYAPNPLLLPETLPQILGAGAELKNCFCLTRDRYAFVSHFIGDLENYETLSSYEETIAHYEKLFKIDPEIFACDMHPDYLATQYARDRACREDKPLIQVQHHHAHLAACLAENGWDSDEPVIGLTFDGTGYGTDGAIWGGEVLVGGYAGFERALHLSYMPLPGGDQAIRKPARTALAYLAASDLTWQAELAPVKALSDQERRALDGQLKHQINTARTSSLGRLFDAVSALAGICQAISYEGQAAILLEAAVDPDDNGSYPLEIAGNEIAVIPLIQAVAADLIAGISPSRIAARFHNALAVMTLNTCEKLRGEHGLKTVALSGGVWQNRTLLNMTLAKLRKASFNILLHHQLPPNDGCIALGQALVAAHTINKEN
ncbi:MAG: carbamoyltransferase HypF [Anaerolineaceae bacterium]